MTSDKDLPAAGFPARAGIRIDHKALAGNLCRCNAYGCIIAAVKAARQE